ncbi:exodeoxyribonuclease VII large subunit [Clostridia bacterium]|nr:exodeoxyribonuclease VII large subunit [Clostridia bacterium]
MLPKSYLEVSQVLRLIKSDLEEDPKLARVWVKGEISNAKKAYSGHIYFTIKDDKASLKSVMFASNSSKLAFELEDGMEVLVQGRISVFEAQGSVQLYVNSILPLGQGVLFMAYTQLKDQLEQEGLFARKRPIPMLPSRIGIVTSATGSVLHDIQHVVTRRNPSVKLVLAKAAVQGKDAPDQIVEAIDLLNRYGKVDLIIVGRGGGSLEELWAFNTESVARAIYNSALPVISAVGHETDFTISDFVADLRAPTPSAAAEVAVPDALLQIANIKERLESQEKSIRKGIEEAKQRLRRISRDGILNEPETLVAKEHERLDAIQERIVRSMQALSSAHMQKLAMLQGRIDGLNPLATLKRGYTVIEQDGKMVYKATELKKDRCFTIRFQDGVVRAMLKEEEA